MPTNVFVSFRYVALCGHNSLSINAKCPKMNTHFPLIVADCQTALTSPPSPPFPPPFSLSFFLWRADSLHANWNAPRTWSPQWPTGFLLFLFLRFYIFLTPFFFVAPLNGMKVYKLSNSSCRQSVPASCQLPDANCQMPVNFWSSPKLSHDIQMA